MAVRLIIAVAALAFASQAIARNIQKVVIQAVLQGLQVVRPNRVQLRVGRRLGLLNGVSEVSAVTWGLWKHAEVWT